MPWPYPFQLNSTVEILTKTRFITYNPQSMLDNIARGFTFRPYHIRTQLAALNPSFVGMQESRDEAFQRRIRPFLVFHQVHSKVFSAANSSSTLMLNTCQVRNLSFLNIPLLPTQTHAFLWSSWITATIVGLTLWATHLKIQHR